MAERIERTYTIPLRREYLKVPKYRRTEKASRALREFIIKHMKSETVKLGKHLNEHLWMHGMKNPPHHVKVNVVKVADGIVYAELFGKPLKIAKEEKTEKKEKTPEKKEEKKVGKETVDAEVISEKTEAKPKKATPKKEAKKE